MRFQGRIAGLDGLRGIAILLTLFCHSPQLERELWVQPTWAGVNLFFVLSGFLITGILLDTKGQGGYFKIFYFRRALRIWPIYYVVLFISLFCLPLILPSLKSLIGYSPLYYILFFQNLKAHNLIFPVLAPTWSLAVEEQFYLIWPLVISLLPSRRSVIWLSVVGLTAFPFIRSVEFNWLIDPAPFRFMTLFRFDGLLVGAGLAALIRTESLKLHLFRWSMVGFAALGLFIFVISNPFRPDADLRFGYGFLNIGFGGLVGLTVLSAYEGGWLSSWLSFRPLQYIGQISYGLYLLHKLAFVVCARIPHFHSLPPWVGVTTQFAVAIAIAACSWHLFESPILQWKNRFNYSGSQTKPLAANA